MTSAYLDHLTLVTAAMDYVFEMEHYELPFEDPVKSDAMTAEVVYSKCGTTDFRPLRKFSPWTRVTCKLFKAVRVVTPSREWIVWEEPLGLYGEFA